MILPWLVVSILFSLFLDKYGDIEFRHELGNKLGLGVLGCEDNGKEFLWACTKGYDKSVERMLRSSDSSVLNKKDTDDT